MKRFIPCLYLTLLILVSPVWGAQPIDVLQKSIEQAMDILEDPKYQEQGQKKAQRDKMWEIIRDIFDLREIAQRTLTRNWRKFTADQQKEFTELFGKFLGDNYLKKIQGGFKGEKIVYTGQRLDSDSKALIQTKIMRETVEIPVDYRMLKRDQQWKIYDVIVEGVSLTLNYRSQFNDILRKESPAELILRIKKKMEEQETEET